MASAFSVDHCVICGSEFVDQNTGVPWRTLHEKGLKSLMKYAEIQGNSLLVCIPGVIPTCC